MDARDIANDIRAILTHDSPVVFDDVAKDVQSRLDKLQAAGDAAVQPVATAVSGCARGSSAGPRWWLGAQELCSMLARIGSPEAQAALLAILKTDSRIVEFDYVRGTAARQLSSFKDPQLLPELRRCLEMPNAPVLAISETMEALGGDEPMPPEVVVEKGRGISDPLEAVRFFAKHQAQVSSWRNPEQQGGFYYFFGRKVERLSGTKAAYPLFAAQLLADPDPNSAAWGVFPTETPSPSSAQALAQKYPLSDEYLAHVEDSPAPTVAPQKKGRFRFR